MNKKKTTVINSLMYSGWLLKKGKLVNHWAKMLDSIIEISEKLMDHLKEEASPLIFWKIRFLWMIKFEAILIDSAIAWRAPISNPKLAHSRPKKIA